MKKKTTKKVTQKVEDWFDSSVNEVKLLGKVKRIIFFSDKVVKFTLDSVTLTPNEKYAHAFIPVTLFTLDNDTTDLVEDAIVEVHGSLATNSYNGKYSTDVMTDYDNIIVID